MLKAYQRVVSERIGRGKLAQSRKMRGVAKVYITATCSLCTEKPCGYNLNGQAAQSGLGGLGDWELTSPGWQQSGEQPGLK